MTLIEQIAEIDNQIAKLQTKKNELTQMILDSDVSFIEKFKVWYLNDDPSSEQDWLPTKGENPILRKKLNDLNRYETYNLDWILGDDFMYCLMDAKEGELNSKTLKLFEKELKRKLPLMEELMKTNLKSFKCDW